VLISYWNNEFEMMTDKLRIEAISPIQNKVGQFISSTVIRNIIKNPKSTIDLQKVMDEGKIVLMNLSQGKLGEDNAALLGAMFITKFQLAAMNRVYLAEDERRDFYLYVDEFQNFATSSFIKILSEARKYRLNLLLANQYIGQIPEDVRLAIFGNCGTMMSFLVGAGDSPYLAKEFSERFKEEDILALANYQAIDKMMIDGRTSPPFMCYTLPLPNSMTQNREKVIKASQERYMKPVKNDDIESKHEEAKREAKEVLDEKESSQEKDVSAKAPVSPVAKPTEQPAISVERKEGPPIAMQQPHKSGNPQQHQQQKKNHPNNTRQGSIQSNQQGKISHGGSGQPQQHQQPHTEPANPVQQPLQTPPKEKSLYS